MKMPGFMVRKVIVGMSGGVDSAMAALILKKRGYDVHGLFMRNWDVANETGKCLADADFEDAKMICEHLEIPLHQVNFVKEYWNGVFSELIKGYENGTTPNPDIMCNKVIKFDAFFKHAFERLGADAIATGHYARTSCGYDLETVDPAKGVKLLTAADNTKDQTFFLSQISQSALQRSLFPIGDLTKDFVKKIACNAGLEKIAKKKESMGICFIGTRNFQNFIEEYIEPKKGRFLHVETGKVMGYHKGTHYWTVGQRAQIAGQDLPYFVSELHPRTQDVIVAPGTDHPSLFTQTLFTEPPHWIRGTPPSHDHMFTAGFRFQSVHPIIRCTATLSGSNCLIVSIELPLRAITAGQYAVFYRGDECLGSARILRPGPSLFTLNYGSRVDIPKEFR
ncbi:mitochondrial tRNA-specific 2-thiouridylase 1-like isoform X1 [Haliotis rubra]|uniref:mitochondrial tRNA-specific 2-thiouridylase 1-like isoform X1 n=2 Tax=Haliotis rubra TaxID=36100 RepID=UPI001EE54400|nr:mitochondrial tRNA-specific 2-thiouridylase 1-like isoform X1 [Haliotis rubra]